MINAEIKIGNYNVLLSGSVLVRANEVARITFRDLALNFIFKDDASQAAPKLEADGNVNELNLTFINYNSGMGHANTKTLPLGSLDNRKLYLNYAVHSFGVPAVMKLLTYTIMLGENV